MVFIKLLKGKDIESVAMPPYSPCVKFHFSGMIVK